MSEATSNKQIEQEQEKLLKERMAGKLTGEGKKRTAFIKVRSTL
jgi:hypothetical protein